MKSCKILLVLVCAMLMASSTLSGQSKFRVKGDEAFEALAFTKAIDYYHRAVAEFSDPHAVRRLAECYRLLTKMDEAEPWYRRAVTTGYYKTIDLLRFARALQYNGKYDEAKKYYNLYAEAIPDDPRGLLGVKACELAPEVWASEPTFHVENLQFNSERRDFGPAFYNDGLVFSSDREARNKGEKVFAWTGAPFTNVFEVYEKANRWTEPEKFKKIGVNSEYHDGPVSFSSNYLQMLVTRSYAGGGGGVKTDNRGVVNLQIMQSSFDSEKEKWRKLEALKFNNREFSCGHPTLTKNGLRMYFSSTMPLDNQYHKVPDSIRVPTTDLYTATWDGEKWSDPVNLGDVINTVGDEIFPFIADDGTLYFASNTHPGLGGFDIFRSRLDEKTNTWSKPEHLGIHVNSSHDDFGFIIDKNNKEAFITSNRKGGKGLSDIYRLTNQNIMLCMKVIDKSTKEVIPMASLNLTDGKVSIFRGMTDEDGMACLEIEPDLFFRLQVTKSRYRNRIEEFNSANAKGGDTINVLVELERDMVLAIEGYVVEKFSGTIVPYSDVWLIEGKKDTVEQVIVGSDAFYYFPLQPERKYTLAGSNEKGEYVLIDGPYYFDTKDVGDYLIIRQDIFLDRLQPGGIIALKSVYFNFDKYYIREDATPDLRKLLDLMKKYPRMRVEMRSHTDSRGSHAYNETLSQNRAEATRNWLISKGISADRIEANGYGETVLRNDCADDVPCTEVEHQRNRRTEFRVITIDGETIDSDERYTTPDEYVPGPKPGTNYRGERPRVISRDDEPEVEPSPAGTQPKQRRRLGGDREGSSSGAAARGQR